MAQPVRERSNVFLGSGFSAFRWLGVPCFGPMGFGTFWNIYRAVFEPLSRLPLLKRARVAFGRAPRRTVSRAPQDGLMITLALKRRPDRAMIGRLHHRSCFVINIRFCELLEHRL